MKSRPTFRYTFIGQRHDRLVSHNIKQTEANSDADLSYSKTRTKHAPNRSLARASGNFTNYNCPAIASETEDHTRYAFV